MKLLLFFLTGILALVAAHGADKSPLNAPMKNFRLPTFSKEGYRVSLLTGSQAIYINANQIDVTDMTYYLYADDGSNLVDTQVLSPAASVVTVDNQIIVQGEKPMRLLRKDLDATGENWTYDHRKKRISIGKNVRVVFQAQLSSLIQ